MPDSTSKTIIYLTLPPNAPSARFRVYQYLNEIKKHGFSVTLKEIPKSTIQRIRLFNSLTGYDIVFLQKRLMQSWFVKLLRKRAKALVYDFDDAILYRSSDAKNKHSANRKRRFSRTVGCADVVIAGNDYLKRLAQPYAKSTVVIPTGIDIDRYLPSSKPNQVLTIGWIGSSSSLIFLKDLIEPINKLYRQNPSFQLKVVCDDFIEGFECPVINKIWSEPDEIRDIQSFDIGLLPMRDDHWTKGKCALKLLQYMSCELPSVSSNTEFVASIINDGDNGLLADDPEQWQKQLHRLLEEGELRAGLGHQARSSIIGTFDIQTIGQQYIAAFKRAIGS